MIRRPPRSTQSRSSAASDVYKRQGLDVPLFLVNRLDLEWQAMTHSIGLGLLLCGKFHADLTTHIARTSPPHQRVDVFRKLRLELKYPFLSIGRTRLHCIFSRLINARFHGLLSFEL
eukprot:TRINITY_DN24715_c0_g1_i1.p1 TRINITY_DN24715_c0_g1~~TRINITY_DN24715_c0_g1_i1.p1  ORF type:complete len:117 (-),score=15.87 TRINITY_DN24715_c0_g1_i1:153-503(-)